MSLEDKIKWNKKYQTTPSLSQTRKASQKLIDFIKYATPNKALDVACGTGRNSIYLAQANFAVDAIDISWIALQRLEQKGYENIHTMLIDLDNYIPEKNSYDLIIMSNFLDKELIPHLYNALKRDGILIIETYMHHNSNEKPNSNPDFLLQKDELKTFFDNSYNILNYDEFDNESEELYKMRKQSIVIQRTQ
ncbi:MAG: methyltransferase domain-containing protein [Arcobacteraceae bacterium]